MISSELIRAARALLRWEQKELAERSGVSLPLIKRLETQPGPFGAQQRTIQSLTDALKAAGIEFLNHGQPGVRLRRQEGWATVDAYAKWWEVHLVPEGWIAGDQQGDFGRLIKGAPRPATAVITVREFDTGGLEVMWQGQDRAAMTQALENHPRLLSGRLAPQVLS